MAFYVFLMTRILTQFRLQVAPLTNQHRLILGLFDDVPQTIDVDVNEPLSVGLTLEFRNVITNVYCRRCVAFNF